MNEEDYVLVLPRDNMMFRSTLVKPFYILNKSITKTDPLESLDQNNQEPKGEDSITINTSLIVKHDRGHPQKYVDITLFLQDNVDYEISR
jgi:hypothetical protein